MSTLPSLGRCHRGNRHQRHPVCGKCQKPNRNSAHAPGVVARTVVRIAHGYVLIGVVYEDNATIPLYAPKECPGQLPPT